MHILAATLALFSGFTGNLAEAQDFFPLKDVRPGQHGVGRTIFHGNRIEEFQVEILGVLNNSGPKQSIILARLSGGTLGETGVAQGMSGSPVYIDGKLLGAVALGFPFSKEAIAGIQPIESMIEGSSMGSPAEAMPGPAVAGNQTWEAAHRRAILRPGSASEGMPSAFGTLQQLATPLSLSGFSPGTLSVFADGFRQMGFEPLQGLSSGSAAPASLSGTVVPGSMISVGLLTGDMNITADGTVTLVDGKKIYAFGHRFLDTGSTELPFARSEVLAIIPNLNSSFKLSAPQEWVGTILSDRASAISGEIGRPAHTVPLSITVHSPQTRDHVYHFQTVNDRLLTPFVTQTALFSVMDATERTLGSGTLQLEGRVEWEGNLPPLIIKDTFVSDSALAQQVSADAVVAMGFVLGGGFRDVHMKSISFQLEASERKRQLHLAQAWVSPSEVRAGEAVQITALLQGEDGIEITRSTTFRVPIGAPTGGLNFTVSDGNTLNNPEFAGLSQSSLPTAEALIRTINAFRDSDRVYVRVWRAEPAFTVSGPSHGGELTDPPPSIALILANPSDSATTNPALTAIRGSQVAELAIATPGYVITGAKTLQVDVHE